MTHHRDFIVTDQDHADWLKARALERDEPAHRDINWPVFWAVIYKLWAVMGVLWLIVGWFWLVLR